MRIKPSDGPLSIHNGNSDILNSPKRLNTLQNSNLTSNLISNLANNTHNVTDSLTLSTDNDLRSLNNINTGDTVQWCSTTRQQKEQELCNNANNRKNQLYNINNTLAATLTELRHGTASSVCSESSPDDSLLDFEEAHQTCSSADVSPQEEERCFDVSDSESLSEDGNVRHCRRIQRHGIVNPNYPGFQHLAHTLDFCIKGSSDTDLTDDDFESESVNDINNINNNNNNNNETEYQLDQIDSVNRLDSVENIQKVFHEKDVFDVAEVCGNNNANQESDDHSAINIAQSFQTTLNGEELLAEEVVTDFRGITLQNEVHPLDVIADEKSLPPLIERFPVEQEAIEQVSIANDIQCAPPQHMPHYVIQSADKLESKAILEPAAVLDDTEIVLQENMAMLISLPLAEISSVKENQAFQSVDNKYETKLADAFLSDVKENVGEKLSEADNDFTMEVENPTLKALRRDSNRETEEKQEHNNQKRDAGSNLQEEVEKFCKEDKTKDDKEKDEDSAVPRKKEKMELNYVKKRRDYNQQTGSLIGIPRREGAARNRDGLNRRSAPAIRDKKRAQSEIFGGFDVYNIETAMPKIDLEAIEIHLRAAREEERRRRTDREEIRRRLAMGSDDYYAGNDRPGRKPSLQARLQSGMNLQICFMNETVSDTESPSSDSECPMTNPKQPKTSPKKNNNNQVETEKPAAPVRPATLSVGQPLLQPLTQPMTETDFFTRQARLQTEARMALAQAKEMARMQMEIERQRQKKSPITEMVRSSLEKVGIPFPEEKRRLSRQILTEMNVAQLQVIVNDLHTQIETLNENLVKFLMNRDDLHMEQDSMLVDIEDLTRFLGAKEQTIKEQNLAPSLNNNAAPPSPAPSSPLAALNSSVKPHLHRIASLVKK